MEIQIQFEHIDSDADVKEFISSYGLEKKEIVMPLTQVLGEWHGMHDGQSIYVKYRWYDPSQAFSIQPDIHVISLTITSPEGLVLYGAERRFDA